MWFTLLEVTFQIGEIRLQYDQINHESISHELENYAKLTF